uniref:Uncharacterized protein n=1 Tax=Rhizophora mucronata TaxID=61149 RepID=A0A2P2NW00_RHIMU
MINRMLHAGMLALKKGGIWNAG